jgi:hypothetical protein
MEKVEEYMDVTPDTRLMNILGRTGYSFSQIQGEFIDNSIDERLDNEKLHVKIIIRANEIIVIDDGKGMTKEQLKRAMTLAKAKKGKGKHGMYGMGMKMAAIASGRYFEVITMVDGDTRAHKSWWSEDQWGKKSDWRAPYAMVEQPKELPKGHGTIIRIKDLRIKTGNKIMKLRSDTGRRYAPYIDSDQAEITVNDKPCKAMKQDLVKDSKRDIDIKWNGKEITGWVGLLKNSSQGGMYGFNTFRYNRLITSYDKIGFNPHPTVARIVGELHMNHIPVNINKTNWERSSAEFEEAVEKIAEEIKDIVKKARDKYKEKKITNTEKNQLEQFKEGLVEAMNDDDLKEYVLPEKAGNNPGNKPTTGKKVTKKGTTEVEKRTRTDPPQNPGTKEPADSGRERKPKRTHPVKKNKIVVKGKQFDYEHQWYKGGSKGPIYDKKFDEKQRKLEIYTNVDFPAAKVTKDRAFYAFTKIVEAITMIIIEQADVDWEHYERIRETLLRKASKHVHLIRNPDLEE